MCPVPLQGTGTGMRIRPPFGEQRNVFSHVRHKERNNRNKKTPTCAVAAEAGGGRQRRENPQTKKAAASYLPLRVFSPPRRLTSEFGMGSGVSAWLSPPPGSSMPCPLETECHCPQPFEKKLRFYEPPGRSALPPAGKIWRSPRAIGATWLCTLPCLHRSSIKRVTCPCPYPLSGWEAYCRERLRA